MEAIASRVVCVAVTGPASTSLAAYGERQAGFAQDPQARGVCDLQVVLVAAQPGDLAVPPHRVLQRDFDDDRADPVACR